MDRREILALLEERGVWHQVTEHEAVYDMAQAARISLPYPDCEAKNLFVRDDKKRGYYLITVKGDRRVDLKAFRQRNGTRPLSFASAEDLMELLGLVPGAVTPFGLLNDGQRRVTLCLDRAFLDGPGLIGAHPNDNTATVWIRAEDLLDILRERGVPVRIVDLTEGPAGDGAAL